MKWYQRLSRLLIIQRVLFRYAIDELLVELTSAQWLRSLFLLFPSRWGNSATRALPRGERLRRALEELGPVFIKFGQMLSTRRDLFPQDISDELALLQDKVPTFSSQDSIRTIEESLNARIDELFADFTEVPLAAASIAQVHAATLHSGEDVVVKVLRPDIEDIIKRDLSLMYLLASLVATFWSEGRRLRPREVVSEYEKTIYDELDMQREASNAAVLRRNFEESEELYIPEIYWDYTKDKVLVMERIDGIPVSDIDSLRSAGVDIKKLAERGVNIFFTQVFRDNFFHADMHPGNIFVSREDPHNPRYIAVDFGIVGMLTDEDRHYLSQNLLAFFDRDYRRVATLHVDSGWVPADTRVEEFESSIRTVCEPIFEKPLAEISFGQVLLRLFQTARRFNMEVQPQLVLLQKTLLNIEGLGRQLYPQLDIWKTARPILKHWMLNQAGPQAVLREIRQNIPEWGRALPQMPGLVQQFLQSASTPHYQRHGHLQAGGSSPTPNTARAIVVGLCAVALFIAAVLILLLAPEQAGRIFGMPVLGWICLAASVYTLRQSLKMTDL